eukprot:2610037-Pleurochrysis_carterae.AAC.1
MINLLKLSGAVKRMKVFWRIRAVGPTENYFGSCPAHYADIPSSALPCRFHIAFTRTRHQQAFTSLPQFEMYVAESEFGGAATYVTWSELGDASRLRISQE